MLFFFALNTGSILSFIIFGSYPVSTLSYVAAYIPFVILGSLLGMRAVSHINNRVFQKVVATLLLIMGFDSLFNIL